MDREKTIDKLNELVEINNDRIEGYEKARENTEESDLKELFSNFKRTSQHCLTELKNEITKLGGEVEDSTNVSGKFFRAWMDVKAALTGKDREAILNSCEYGEDQADKTYQKTLDEESEHLSLHQKSMIKSQHKKLKSDHSNIQLMLSDLVDTK